MMAPELVTVTKSTGMFSSSNTFSTPMLGHYAGETTSECDSQLAAAPRRCANYRLVPRAGEFAIEGAKKTHYAVKRV